MNARPFRNSLEPDTYTSRECETCGQKTAHYQGKPIRSHRRGRFHQAAVAKRRKEREGGG